MLSCIKLNSNSNPHYSESLIDTNVNQSPLDSVLVVAQHYEFACPLNMRENFAAISWMSVSWMSVSLKNLPIISFEQLIRK